MGKKGSLDFPQVSLSSGPAWVHVGRCEVEGACARVECRLYAHCKRRREHTHNSAVSRSFPAQNHLRHQDIGLKTHLDQLDQQISELQLGMRRTSAEGLDSDSRPSSGAPGLPACLLRSGSGWHCKSGIVSITPHGDPVPQGPGSDVVNGSARPCLYSQASLESGARLDPENTHYWRDENERLFFFI